MGKYICRLLANNLCSGCYIALFLEMNRSRLILHTQHTVCSWKMIEIPGKSSLVWTILLYPMIKCTKSYKVRYFNQILFLTFIMMSVLSKFSTRILTLIKGYICTCNLVAILVHKPNLCIELALEKENRFSKVLFLVCNRQI